MKKLNDRASRVSFAHMDRVQIARKISAPATQSGRRASQKERRYSFRVSGWNLRGFVQLPED
jgi:hypothetical protein